VVLEITCLFWSWTIFLLISAWQVARITGMCNWLLA
jgi:hypothetical protein